MISGKELSEAQVAAAKQIFEKLQDYLWDKVMTKVAVDGMTLEEAIEQVKEDIVNG